METFGFLSLMCRTGPNLFFMWFTISARALEQIDVVISDDIRIDVLIALELLGILFHDLSSIRVKYSASKEEANGFSLRSGNIY